MGKLRITHREINAYGAARGRCEIYEQDVRDIAAARGIKPTRNYIAWESHDAVEYEFLPDTPGNELGYQLPLRLE